MSTLVVQCAWCQNEAGGTGMKIPRSNPFGCWLAGVSLESFSVLKLLFLRSPSSDQPLEVRTIDGRNRASPTRLWAKVGASLPCSAHFKLCCNDFYCSNSWRCERGSKRSLQSNNLSSYWHSRFFWGSRGQVESKRGKDKEDVTPRSALGQCLNPMLFVMQALTL